MLSNASTVEVCLDVETEASSLSPLASHWVTGMYDRDHGRLNSVQLALQDAIRRHVGRNLASSRADL